MARRREARPYRGTEPRARTGNGTYAYCVCCAETAADLQKLSEGTRGPALLRSSPDDLWTLAERAFFGVMGEVDTKSPAYKTLELFKMLFGDVVLKKAGGETPAVTGGEGLFLRTEQERAAKPAGERIAATGEPYFHYAFQMPKADPRRVVGMYKNRCYFSPGGAVRSDLGKSGEDCGLEEETRFLVTKGICPSLMAILNNWEEILAPRKPDAPDEILIARQSPGEIDLDRLWMEATVGHPLTGRDIKEILSLNGDPSSRIRPDREREMAARFIETWCDASAISAAARFYTTFKTRVLDHVILSRILTQREKMELMQLVDRYHEYFALAELDANTSLASTAALVGASISYDRYKAAHAGSMTSTGHSTNIVAANDGSLNQWGSQAGPTIASTGGGSSRSRIFATFSRDFSVRPSTAELLEGYRKEFGVEGEHAVARLELNREDLVEKALEGLTMPGR